MAPSRSKTATAANPTRRIMTRSIYKKQQQTTMSSSEAVSSSTKSSNSTDASGDNKSCQEGEMGALCSDICSTPKGNKYLIPKISTCPPAPKKKRLVLNCLSIRSSSSTSSASSAAKFFAHSDVELFFLFAPRNIHA